MHGGGEAGEDRPEGHEVQQGERGGQRRQERDHPRRDGGQALDGERPPPLVALGRPDPRDDGEDAVDQRVGSEQEDEHGQRHARADEGDQPEQDGQHASERQRPPVPDQHHVHGRASLAPPPSM